MQDTTEHAIIRDLDQAWTDLILLQRKFEDDRFYSYEDRYNSVGYMQTARRSIARHRMELDAYRAGRAASEARVNRLANMARDTGLLKAAVAYLVYGTAVLDLADAAPAAQPTTTAISTLAAEDFKVGYRYWPVRPGYESNWTIANVFVTTSDYEVQRDGQWIHLELVTIVRRDGNIRTFEKGEQIAIQGPWRTV